VQDQEEDADVADVLIVDDVDIVEVEVEHRCPNQISKNYNKQTNHSF
jgi:hypothetical protein